MSHNRPVRRLTVRPLRALALAAAFGVGGSLLAGCTSDPGAAAIIGNGRISDNALHNIVDAAYQSPAFATQFAKQRPTVTRQALSTLITLRLVQAAAAQQHITVTGNEVTQFYNSLVQQEGSKQTLQNDILQQLGAAPSQIRDVLTEQLLIEKLATKLSGSSSPSQTQVTQIVGRLLAQETQRLGVHVDPRYGHWVPSAGGVFATNSPVSRSVNTGTTANIG